MFTRNTTDALNLLAAAVPGSVLCLDVEHHANLLPWRSRTHRTLPAAATVAQTLADLDGRAAGAARRRCSRSPGRPTSPARCCRWGGSSRSRTRAGARVVVDAAQLAPHRRVDLAATGVDYVALSGHKLYAPFGAGALVGRRDWLDAAPPYLAGGGAVTEVDLDEATWAPAPHRHEARHPERPRHGRARPGLPDARAGAGRAGAGPRARSCSTGSRPVWRRCRA